MDGGRWKIIINAEQQKTFQLGLVCVDVEHQTFGLPK